MKVKISWITTTVIGKHIREEDGKKKYLFKLANELGLPDGDEITVSYTEHCRYRIGDCYTYIIPEVIKNGNMV